MMKVMVIGRPERLEEFAKLELKGCEVTYFDQINLDIAQMQEEMKEISGGAVGDDFLNMDVDDELKLDEELLENEFDGDENEIVEGELVEDPNEGEEEDAGPSPVLNLEGYSVVFDLNLDQNPDNLYAYAWNPNLIVFGCSVLNNLLGIVDEYLGEVECKLFGINSLPGFIARKRFEVCLYRVEEKPALEEILKNMGMEFDLVEDRVGMVSPRVVCMIINEACYMVKEGTAGMKEVDLAMKLGTNYPFGPFEWADKIGVANVYQVVDAVWKDTHDPRYMAAPLLKQQYLKSEKFYQN